MIREKISIASVALALAGQVSCMAPKEESEGPYNVLFITVDDLGQRLGAYGDNQVHTPNIDQLASRAALFENAYCAIPICMGSRACALTGVHALSPNVKNGLRRADSQLGGATALPKLLKGQGYYTISNGKVFHDRDDSEDSWSEPAWRPQIEGKKWLDPDSENYQKYSSYSFKDPKTKKRKKVEGYRGPIVEGADVPDSAYFDGKVLERSLIDLRRLKKKGQPFFLAVGFVKPHLPFYAPKKYWDMYDREAIKVAGNTDKPLNLPKQVRGSREYTMYHHRNLADSTVEFHKMARHGYYAAVSYVDSLLGRLMDELKAQGLDKNTVVVFWGDHGFHLGEHSFWGKHNVMSNALSIPMMVRMPGQEKSVRVSVPANASDLYPTVCELLGVTIPDHVGGNSLVPYFKGQGKPTQAGYSFARWQGADVVMDGRYVYSEWRKEGKVIAKMLYNHKKDPEENNNVAHDPVYASTVKELSKALDAERKHQATVYPK
ncbi:iduronate-2-sulfatase (plasmid) [Fulvitalea axinellae]|uniref:Iduronate-2-sulfatase n=1 Tax=Fulvitalea axinellae TaxID=1182444 RepID=A0AAU9CSE0_9BACT|nr:iduronate-2-sulfatase [Fulvitalea axinellae]